MRNLALFDFDGTITSKDTFTPFVFYAVEPVRTAVGKVILSPLVALIAPGRVTWLDFEQERGDGGLGLEDCFGGGSLPDGGSGDRRAGSLGVQRPGRRVRWEGERRQRVVGREGRRERRKRRDGRHERRR